MKITNKFLTYRDYRGDILNIFDFTKHKKLKSALIISSKRGSVRANHYHKKDVHYIYLLSGKLKYYEKKPDNGQKIRSKLIKEKEMIKTEAGIIHAMKFLKDSVMIVFTTESRKQSNYERDTIRVKLI